MNTLSLRFLSLSLIAATACARTIPGTHVELVDETGGRTYVGGAAAAGLSNSVACPMAVSQSVAAIALKFSQENSRLGDEVAKQAGLQSGEALLQRYAKAEAMNATVTDSTYDPGAHICTTIVRWKPPMFVRDGLLKFVQELKQREESPSAAPQASSAPPATAGTSPAPAPTPPPAANPPPAPATAAANAPPSPAQAPAAGPVVAPRCDKPKLLLANSRKTSQRVQADFDECLLRTDNDAKVCVRYKMYVDEAQKAEAAASLQLADCLNAPLPTKWRAALQKLLPEHGATLVETRGNGGILLWTYGVGDGTAYALELAEDGHEAQRTPLVANQVPWIRQQLGL